MNQYTGDTHLFSLLEEKRGIVHATDAARERDYDMKKRISVIGDSISTFEGFIPTINRCFYYPGNASMTGVPTVADTWWMRTIDALDAEFLANASYSGSMVEGIGFPAGESPERARQVLGSGDEMPDDILVFYGINDYGWGGAVAQAEGRATNVPVWFDLLGYPEGVAGVAPEDAVSLFEQAYERMLANLHEVVPSSSIHCITLLPGRVKGHRKADFCYALRGDSLDEYNEAIAHAAAAQGCDVVDIRAFGYDYQASDGTHPDDVGMQQIAAMVVAAMKGLATPLQLAGGHFDTDVLFPDHMRSDRFCFKPNCIGCEFATDTGNKWSLVCNKLN